jgi:peptidoglycan/xylan/chitin deacetylase (PgdA/CDA1 family)
VLTRARPAAAAGRLRVEREVLARRRSPSPSERARVLAYHSVGTPSWGVNDLSPARFERHLQLAADEGYTFATPAEVRAQPDRKLLAITFDDGVRSVLTNAAPVLRHHGIPWVMFVVTGWADGAHPTGHDLLLDWTEVAATQAAGATLGSHSVSHPDFGGLAGGDAERELADSRAALAARLGVDVTEFAIPLGQRRNWTPEAGRRARDAGYEVVYAQSFRVPGTVPRTFITRVDRPDLFRAALRGAFDAWEEWF